MCKKCNAKLLEIDGRMAHFIDGLNSKKIPANLDPHLFLKGVREYEDFKATLHTKRSLLE